MKNFDKNILAPIIPYKRIIIYITRLNNNKNITLYERHLLIFFSTEY